MQGWAYKTQQTCEMLDDRIRDDAADAHPPPRPTPAIRRTSRRRTPAPARYPQRQSIGLASVIRSSRATDRQQRLAQAQSTARRVCAYAIQLNPAASRPLLRSCLPNTHANDRVSTRSAVLRCYRGARHHTHTIPDTRAHKLLPRCPVGGVGA